MLPNFYSTKTKKGFHWPGRIIHGSGCVTLLDEVLKCNAKILLIIDQAIEIERFIKYSIKTIYQVKTEPSLRCSLELLNLTSDIDYDYIIAVGGGSTIDLAKMITDKKRYPEGFKQDREFCNALPLLIVIPTLNGSGSETSRFFVISDSNNIKVSYRSWSNVPNLTIIDPDLIIGAGKNKILLGAFDTFIHLWETLICNYEKNHIISMNAYLNIPIIIDTVKKIVQSNKLNIEDVEKIALTSAIGGISISNVRTGIIHTLGEALSSQISLSHPLTLFVFFESCFLSYRYDVNNEWCILEKHLNLNEKSKINWSYEYLIDFWKNIFNLIDVNNIINKKYLYNVDKIKLINCVKNDKVLIKENPGETSIKNIEEIINKSLGT